MTKQQSTASQNEKLTLKDIGLRYVISVKNDCCYICCRETIIFLFEYYRNSDFYFAITDEPVFFNEMVKSDNEDIYLMSEETIFFYFSSSLILFHNEPV